MLIRKSRHTALLEKHHATPRAGSGLVVTRGCAPEGDTWLQGDQRGLGWLSQVTLSTLQANNTSGAPTLATSLAPPGRVSQRQRV
jgi:hypothetical protein